MPRRTGSWAGIVKAPHQCACTAQSRGRSASLRCLLALKQGRGGEGILFLRPRTNHEALADTSELFIRFRANTTTPVGKRWQAGSAQSGVGRNKQGCLEHGMKRRFLYAVKVKYSCQSASPFRARHTVRHQHFGSVPIKTTFLLHTQKLYEETAGFQKEKRERQK
jgi:hypothetical protein